MKYETCSYVIFFRLTQQNYHNFRFQANVYCADSIIFWMASFRGLELPKANLTFSQSGSVMLNSATILRLIGCLHTNFQHISRVVNFARADTELKCSAKKGCFCSQKRWKKCPYAKLNLSLYLHSHVCARATQKIKESRSKLTSALEAMMLAVFTVGTWCIEAYNVPLTWDMHTPRETRWTRDARVLNRELKQPTFLSHRRKPAVNISHTRTVAYLLDFSN